MKTNLTLLLLFLASINMLAQSAEGLEPKDKIYLLNGAEMEVELLVNDKTKSGKWLFFINNAGRLDSLSARQVLSYRDIYGQTFVAKQFGEQDKKQFIFAKSRTYRGIEFYQYEGNKEGVIWFKQPNTNKEYYLTETDYKNQLKAIYPTSENQSAFLKYISFSIPSISRAVKKFEEEDFSILMQTQFSIEGGLDITQFYWTNPELSDPNFRPTSSFVAGFQINVPLYYSQVSLTSGLFYSQLRFLNELSYEDTNRFSFSANQFKIPFMLRYTFERTSIRPYIATGMVFTVNSSSRFNEVRKETIDSTYAIDLVASRTLTKNPVHLALVAGVSFRLRNDRFVYLESRYNYQIIKVPLQNNSFQVVCGITL